MINHIFKKTAKENRAALVVFISCGDPDIGFTEKLVRRVCDAGADMVELGVPFSDPMADGKSIQAASRRAAGTSVRDVLEMSARLRKAGVSNPFILFSYMNPLFKFGLEKLAAESSLSEIDAWLVVDVPMEESDEILIHTRPRGIDFIPLGAPTSSLDRIEKISECGSGFLYYVTVMGVTGVRNALPPEFVERIAEVRKASVLPVAAGFGISNPQMASLAARHADAVVVGSKIVDMAHDALLSEGEAAALDKVGEFVGSLVSAMKR